MFIKVIKAEDCNYNLLFNHFGMEDFLSLEISFMQRWLRGKERDVFLIALPGKEAFSYSNDKVS